MGYQQHKPVAQPDVGTPHPVTQSDHKKEVSPRSRFLELGEATSLNTAAAGCSGDQAQLCRWPSLFPITLTTWKCCPCRVLAPQPHCSPWGSGPGPRILAIDPEMLAGPSEIPGSPERGQTPFLYWAQVCLLSLGGALLPVIPSTPGPLAKSTAVSVSIGQLEPSELWLEGPRVITWLASEHCREWFLSTESGVSHEHPWVWQKKS